VSEEGHVVDCGRARDALTQITAQSQIALLQQVTKTCRVKLLRRRNVVVVALQR